MFDLELDDEQKMLVESIERFSATKVNKAFRDADEEGQLPPDLVKAGWGFGLLPASIPEYYGGFGEYSAVTGALAMEAFAFGDLALSLSISSPGLVALPIMLAGTEEQKARYLPTFCEEHPPPVTAGLTEPVVLFDPRNLTTTAQRCADGYSLNGVKSMVPLANSAETMLIYANEEGQTQGYLVPADSPGLEVGQREKLMGIRALPTYTLTLEDCQIPLENKLGGDKGIDFDLILNHQRVALGAAAVGLAKAGCTYACDYAKNRVQFGEPIAHRQSIAFMLAEMAIDVDAARLMVWETAWKLDQGEDANKEAALMKYFVDQMVLRVADRTVQTLGGYGYIREFPAELWLRNSRGFSAFEGLAII
jgi:acyl-CoA dehydrogenase